ncbi:MAG TPA: Trk family potassium uptake protein [Candidatus Eubacterium faecipullorum]|uniref:Trk family potassium uptake protein n=1 Tax=Candidatus Eubacterium faecipullorum TaxID=2838571 RepID=A0A9D1RBJ2_9FIRM|nr:Trk family potassium uptake protein [Candidatus Eubacterium faecipullorum]
MSNDIPKKKKFHLSSFQIIILGFAGVILLGSLLLCLPISTSSGEWASYLDALFTATTSVCVTGLVTQDTGTYWSLFGQIIILILIQIGGMGVMTVAIMLGLMARRRRFSLMQRSTLQEAIGGPSLGSIIKLTKFIITVTAATEIAGAVCMFPVFNREFGVLKSIWYSVFHSVSAFCNAGIDLMGSKEQFSSLTSYYDNPVINLVICFLIFFGGIGFMTWDDMHRNGIRFKKYRLQSKIALVTTAFLVIVPAVYFYIFEFSRAPWDGFTAGEKVLASIFQTVTPRTAGFNTVDLNAMTQVSQLVMVILMLIGGSPGSTAGGMKTTTAAIVISSMLSVFKRKGDAEAFRRRVSQDSVRNASAVMAMYLVLFLLGSMFISQIEDLPILTCFYETASAIGTVGLSLGITPHLTAVSKIILILLMYFGRVGGLTLIFAAVNNNSKKYVKFPQENVNVG